MPSIPSLKTHSLIFVYNAERGFFPTLKDIAHKLLSPATYPCQLCAVTHGVIGMDSRWREFISAFPGELEFLHRSEYLSRTDLPKVSLPVIFEKLGDATPRVLVTSEEISAIASATDLIPLIQRRLVDSQIGKDSPPS